MLNNDEVDAINDLERRVSLLRWGLLAVATGGLFLALAMVLGWMEARP